MRVVITGGAGRSGKQVARYLRDKGHDILTIDLVPTGTASLAPEVGSHLLVDMTDLGETIEALDQADAVVHLGAIWAAGVRTDTSTFDINVISTFNVFKAAAINGVKRVVWASTGAVTGSPLTEVRPPAYLPIDEDHPLSPRNSYALSKVVGETVGSYFASTSGLEVVGLRLAWMLYPDGYDVMERWQRDPMSRRFNAFVYSDVRDVVVAIEQCLEAEIEGSHVLNICAADTCMNIESGKLVDQAFPGIELKRPLEGFESFVSTEAARELIGYLPQYSWREQSLSSTSERKEE